MIEQKTTVYISSSSNTKRDAYFCTIHKHEHVLADKLIDWFCGKMQTFFLNPPNCSSLFYFASGSVVPVKKGKTR